MARSHPLPDKLFFRIGEVAEIVGVRPHVLRYWEEELGVLKPMKTRGAHRQYRRRDVELALLIKRLLYEEGLTLAGVRKRLRERGYEVRAEIAPSSSPRTSRELELRAELLAVRAELVALLERLECEAADRGPAEPSAASSEPGPSSDGASDDPTTAAGTVGTVEIALRIESSRRER
jgi:DNA-binding transcriptional MerR regulator